MMLAPEAPRLETGGANLPLTKVTAGGRITPTTADLKIAQEFTNGDKLADVTYHCPLHPDWAVRAVTMTCGERTIHTVVMPNQQAQETFDQAREDGYTAILADEVASDELRLQLANVPAGATVEVLTEVVAWPTVEDARGSIVIPLINGSKYGGTEAQQPHFDADDIYAKHTGCHLDLELDVQDPQADFGDITDGKIQGEIEPVGQITISFSATANALWHEDESGKYLVVGVPAIRPNEPSYAWGKVAMLIDRSGSMGGQGLNTATQAARQIVDRISDRLRFVYTFESHCEPIWAADAAVRRRGRTDLSAIDAISHISATGGTELMAAIDRVHGDLKGMVSDVVLITDALVYQNEYQELIRSVKRMTADGIAVHVFLVGPAPGRFIGECISQAGGGFYMEEATGSRYRPEVLEDSVDRFLSGGATLESVTIDGSETRCKHPVRGRPVMVATDADQRPTNVGIQMEGVGRIDVPVIDSDNARFVWAKEKVMELVRSGWASGESIERNREEIEKIGVDHQILTPFTSMVGFDPSQAHDRSDVQQAVAQASLPTGMDAGAFFGIGGGGALGIQGASMIAQAMSSHDGAAALSACFCNNLCDAGDQGAAWIAADSLGGSRELNGRMLWSAGGSRVLSSGMGMRKKGGRIGSFQNETVNTRTSWTDAGADQSSTGLGVLKNIVNSDPTREFYSPHHTPDNWASPKETGPQGSAGATGATGDVGPAGAAFTGPICSMQDEISSILGTILDRIEAGEDPIGDGNWLGLHSNIAVVAASGVLKDAGCLDLAARLVKAAPSTKAASPVLVLVHTGESSSDLASRIADLI